MPDFKAIFGVVKEILKPARKDEAGSRTDEPAGIPASSPDSSQTGSPDRSPDRSSDTGATPGAMDTARLCRRLLAAALVMAFLWELTGRPLISHFWPDASLPPSALKEITSLLMGLIGLGL